MIEISELRLEFEKTKRQTQEFKLKYPNEIVVHKLCETILDDLEKEIQGYENPQ